MITQVMNPTSEQYRAAVENFGFNPCLGSDVKADFMRNRVVASKENRFGQEKSRYGWMVYEIDGEFQPINFRNLDALHKAAEWH
jgi:hypothetical protein